jgi:adenylate cyclase
VAVNLAARVGDHVEVGESLATRAFVDQLTAQTRADFRDVGEMRFRNVPSDIALFAHADHTDHDLPVDPVCQMRVEPSCSQHTERIEDRTWWFCSPDCRERFHSQPHAYVEIDGRRSGRT